MDIGKILLVYLSMAIAVSLFFPQVVINNDCQTSGDPNSIIGIFNVCYNQTSKSVQLLPQDSFNDDNLNLAVDQNPPESGGIFSSLVEASSTFYQSFIDGLKNVLGTIKILFKFLFSPLIFAFDPNLLGSAPIYIKLIFALPLVLMGLIALVRFISGRVGG